MKHSKEKLIIDYLDVCLFLGRKPKKNEHSINGLASQNTYRRYGISISDDWFDELVYSVIPKKCKECSTEIPRNHRKRTFCNRSCAAAYNNNKKRRGSKIKECLNCKKPLSNSRKKYCDNHCQQRHTFIVKYEKWKSGSNEFTASMCKKFLIHENGYQCEKCGISEWMGEYLTLELDHVSGDSEDNSDGNVRLLCPNCHSQTDTYKAKNIGNGRYFRKLRYKEGKSY